MNQEKDDFNILVNEFNKDYYQLPNAVYQKDIILIDTLLENMRVYYHIFNEYIDTFPQITLVYLQKIKRILMEANISLEKN